MKLGLALVFSALLSGCAAFTSPKEKPVIEDKVGDNISTLSITAAAVAAISAAKELGSLTPSAAQSRFSPLEFLAAPTPRNREKITISNGFAAAQLRRVTIPQLIGIDGSPASGTVQIHRLAAVAFTALWVTWEVAGYLNQVLSFDGTFEPRFVRGSAAKQTLSNHAFGVAFDINVEWNAFGAEPASRGMKGCLYDLVPIANQHGFFWGGHYKTRRDGMHFEFVG